MNASAASPPQVSIVSPVFGCRDCLAALVDAVAKSMESSGLTWELVLVDDCGPDHPWTLIADLAARDPRIRGVKLTRNHGQHLAIWAGLEVARGPWVAVIDCDLQDDPAAIPVLYAEATSTEVDAVLVDRGEWSDSRFRRAASTQFYRLVKVLAGVRIDNIGNFGIYSRRMVNMLLGFTEQEVFLPMMIALTGLPTGRIQIDRQERAAGLSAYSALGLVRLAMTIVVRFSDRPLKLSALTGFVFSALAALVSIYLVLGYLVGAFTVPGWTSVVLSVWFLSGLILMTLGIHGFYLGRVFAEVRVRPRISVMTTTFEQETAHRDGTS